MRRQAPPPSSPSVHLSNLATVISARAPKSLITHRADFDACDPPDSRGGRLRLRLRPSTQSARRCSARARAPRTLSMVWTCCPPCLPRQTAPAARCWPRYCRNGRLAQHARSNVRHLQSSHHGRTTSNARARSKVNASGGLTFKHQARSRSSGPDTLQPGRNACTRPGEPPVTLTTRPLPRAAGSGNLSHRCGTDGEAWVQRIIAASRSHTKRGRATVRYPTQPSAAIVREIG